MKKLLLFMAIAVFSISTFADQKTVLNNSNKSFTAKYIFPANKSERYNFFDLYEFTILTSCGQTSVEYYYCDACSIDDVTAAAVIEGEDSNYEQCGNYEPIQNVHIRYLAP